MISEYNFNLGQEVWVALVVHVNGRKPPYIPEPETRAFLSTDGAKVAVVRKSSLNDRVEFYDLDMVFPTRDGAEARAKDRCDVLNAMYTDAQMEAKA